MKTKSYIIQPGDTMTAIAVKHGVELAELAELNPQVSDINRIYAGCSLAVPDTRSIFETMVDYVAERLSTQSKGGPVMLPLSDGSILVYLPPSAGMDDVLAISLEVEARRQPVKV